MAPCRASACRRTSCSPATAPARGSSAPASSTSGRRGASSDASPKPSTCARAAPTRRRARSRAAICRNSSSAGNSTGSPGVLVVCQPTWGVDAGAAATIRQALIDLARCRLGGARHQPGPRRDPRDLRPHRGDLARAGCRAPRDAARHHARADRPADAAGGQARGRRMRIELIRRPERSGGWRILSPMIAIALTVVAGFIIFAAGRRQSASRRSTSISSSR